MNKKNLVTRLIFPVTVAVFLIALFYPLCVDNGDCDYMKLWMLTGITLVIHRMYFWLILKGFDIGGTNRID